MVAAIAAVGLLVGVALLLVRLQDANERAGALQVSLAEALSDNAELESTLTAERRAWDASLAAVGESMREAANRADRLAARLEEGRKNDPELAACLDMRLPTPVIDSLPH